MQVTGQCSRRHLVRLGFNLGSLYLGSLPAALAHLRPNSRFLHGHGLGRVLPRLVSVQGMIAEYECAKILERGRRGRRHAAHSGLVSALGKVPYGYRYVAKDAGGGVARVDVAPDEARWVRLMFAWIGPDRLSLREVARRLYEAGVPTSTGKARWDGTGLRLCGAGEWLAEKHGTKLRRSLTPLRGASLRGIAFGDGVSLYGVSGVKAVSSVLAHQAMHSRCRGLRRCFLVQHRAVSSSRPERRRAPRAAAVNTGRRPPP
jgi:hypothetical protein